MYVPLIHILDLVWEMLTLLQVILIDENLGIAVVLDQGFCSELAQGCFDGLLRRMGPVSAEWWALLAGREQSCKGLVQYPSCL